MPRGRRPQKGTSGESLMDMWLRERMHADPAIDRDVARSCESKQPYKSVEEARAVAAMNGMSGSLYTYQCRYCEWWHLTRRPTSEAHDD